MSQGLMISPLATFCVQRLGTHVTLFVGIALETISFIGASFASQIWHLFLAQGLCFGWGMGFLFTGSVGIVAQWFSKRRSLANGIAAAGSGFGGLSYSLAAHAAIAKLGLPWAFRVLGICAFVINTICCILLKDRNAAVGARHVAFDFRLLKRPEVLTLLAFGTFSMLAYVLFVFSMPNFASSIGLTAQQGSVVGALLNLGQGLGRPPIGYFSDTIGRINIAGSLTLVAGVLALAIWTNTKTYGLLIFYSLAGGTVAGTYWAVVAPVTAEVVGLSDLPSALSITWAALTISSLCESPQTRARSPNS
jgi:MFS family permease